MYVKFEVLEAYKGVVDSENRRLRTPATSASCGFLFETGQTYLIYAWRAEHEQGAREQAEHELEKDRAEAGRLETGWLETGLCTRTAVADRSSEEIDVLRDQYINEDW